MTSRKPAVRTLVRAFARVALAALAFAALPSLHPTAAAQKPNPITGLLGKYRVKSGTAQAFELAGFPGWLSLDFQVRDRLESQDGYQYTAGNNRIYDLSRIWGAATVRPAKFLTVYGQFLDTHALGLPVKSVASNMRDNFDLRQGYILFHHGPARIYAGRKELRFGNERILGISDFTNNSRTADGFFGHFGNRNSVDVFSSSIVSITPYSLDKHGAGLTVHGVWGHIGTWIPGGVDLQPFVLVHALPRVTSRDGVSGTETEVAFGAEAAGDHGPFSYDLVGNLERGSYSNASIHAGADIEKVYYTFRKMPWRPRIGGEYDYATGDPHTNPAHHSTYDQFYPSNHNSSGFFDFFGFENLKMQRVNFDVMPAKNLVVLIQGEAIGVASRFDNVYTGSAGTAVAAPAGGFKTNSIGDGIDFSGKYIFRNHYEFNAAYSHYFPGSLMSAAGKGVPLNYAMLSLTCRFRVDK